MKQTKRQLDRKQNLKNHNMGEFRSPYQDAKEASPACVADSQKLLRFLPNPGCAHDMKICSPQLRFFCFEGNFCPSTRSTKFAGFYEATPTSLFGCFMLIVLIIIYTHLKILHPVPAIITYK